MTTRPRPNRDALSEAIDIYRDAMRPFILRRLRQVRGTTLDKAITSALGDRRRLRVHLCRDVSRLRTPTPVAASATRNQP